MRERPRKDETRVEFLKRAGEENLWEASHVWRLKNQFTFEVIEHDRLPDPPMNLVETDAGLRLFITDVIGDDMATQDIVSAIRSNPTADIEVEINTPGGSVPHAMSIFNAMVEHEGNITTQITGQAASAGMIVASGGDRVIANETASVMLHPANLIFLALLPDDRDFIDFANEAIDKASDQIRDMLATRSGQTPKAIEDLMQAKNGKGTTLTATEAFDLGLVDEVRETPAKPANKIPKPLMDRLGNMARDLMLTNLTATN